MNAPELKLVQVGECIGPIRTWNPAQDSEDETFRYIDISSVSQEEKRIIPNGEIPIAEAPSRARQLVQTGDVSRPSGLI
jgi:type I restriction enzyme, S subunit